MIRAIFITTNPTVGESGVIYRPSAVGLREGLGEINRVSGDLRRICALLLTRKNRSCPVRGIS